jgi:hypothetical protein
MSEDRMPEATAPLFVNCMLIDFTSENDLDLYLKTREEMMTPAIYDKLAKAGLMRQVVSKVWNKDQHRLSVVFEYRSQEAFLNCREIWDGEVAKSPFLTRFAMKRQNNRGVVVSEFVAGR